MLDRDRCIAAVVTASVCCFGAVTANAVDVDAVVTADNAYGFGFGDVNGMTTASYFGGLRNVTPAQIFNGAPQLYTAGDANGFNGFTNPGVGPELYDLNNLPVSDYLYIVAWSDDKDSHGVIGDFTVGSQSFPTVAFTGWEVYATGLDRDSDSVVFPFDTLTNSPSDIALINSQIALANANAGPAATTSVGWVDEKGELPDSTFGEGRLVFGEDNTNGSMYLGNDTFPVVAGLPAASRWMWYNEDPVNINNPFRELDGGGPDGHKEFLIFRIALTDVPEPGAVSLLALGGLALLRRRG